ncbi:MAG: ATP-binding protein [Solirubrobacteraceae bacterium]
MQRLSIVRSLRLALIGLTLVLALVAALGVGSLLSARQTYENTLVSSSGLSASAAELDSAGIAQEQILRETAGPAARAARREARTIFAHAVASALSLAAVDPASRALIRDRAAAQARISALAGRTATSGDAIAAALTVARRLTDRLQARQQARESLARMRARSDSRRALVLVIAAGVLALAAALMLITALVGAMRRPLDALVGATRALACGELERRVTPAGPRELRELGSAFNSMGEELSEVRVRIEHERRRLAVTIASLGDALLVTEPGSDRVATVNPRVAELVPELAPGTPIDSDESPLPPLADALRGETTIEHHGRILAVTAARLGSESDGVVWTVRDVSERARLERAKSEFVATASHELRSPLTSIKGFVELLARASEGMTARQREFVDIILRSTDRLVDLVDDLLDVARIEADHVEISRRPIDLGEAVHEVAELMGPRFAEKRQQLGVYVAPSLPLAYADPGRVRQIIANLLTNAHLYTEAGGRIHIGAEADRAWLQLVVADSGVGMTAEQSSRVFERFYRAGSGTDGRAGSPAPGTGLGLSIVKSLVELHDGEIEVKSEPGRGTTFRVRIPAALPEPESARSLETLRGRRVLIVDDEAEVAELIAGQLAPLDVDATIVNSGEEALRMLRGGHFDAVTIDILMAPIDGFEVLRQVRDDPELRSIPIVFVSVFSGRQELAGEWVVSKPIDADELRGVLRAAVIAGRSSVLVVAREQLQPILAPALADLGIQHQWELTGPSAARACRERRFELALVDVGIRNPQAVLQALDLRGRRERRSVILVSDGVTPMPPGIRRAGVEVVPVAEATSALLAALRGHRAP